VVGDAIQAAFSLATQGVDAAIAGQRALRAEDWGESGPIQVRMGLHTGPAELAGEDYAISHTLNGWRGVMSAGHGGQILLSQATVSLVQREIAPDVSLQDLGEHYLKGLTAARTACSRLLLATFQRFSHLSLRGDTAKDAAPANQALPPSYPTRAVTEAKANRTTAQNSFSQTYPDLCSRQDFGKTTLLLEWIKQNPEQGRWLSLDQEDNEPKAFSGAILLLLFRRTNLPSGSAHWLRWIPPNYPD